MTVPVHAGKTLKSKTLTAIPDQAGLTFDKLREAYTRTAGMQPYTIVLDPDPDEGGYTITVPALPGRITWGQTIEQCHEQAQEACADHGAFAVGGGHDLLGGAAGGAFTGAQGEQGAGRRLRPPSSRDSCRVTWHGRETAARCGCRRLPAPWPLGKPALKACA